METISVQGLALYFEVEERQTAEFIRQACERSVGLLHELWGLEKPEDCRVYVMTSWSGPIFHAAPWFRRILLGLSLPLWGWRARRLWPVAGGWSYVLGKRRVVGVKPPRLLRLSDRRMGERIFIHEEDINQKVQQLTCHELTHAFSAYLRLPAWLNEGLAMLTVDRFAGKETIRPETITALSDSAGKRSPSGYRGLNIKDQEAVVYLYVRGYWITRYLEETHLGLLKGLLTKRHRPIELENQIASTLGMRRAEFWRDIDGVVADHFKQDHHGNA